MLQVSLAWFYKWLGRAEDPDGLHTDTDRRRAELDVAVAEAFAKAKGLHGSPRLVDDLRDEGWTVSVNTVAESMRRQQLVARAKKRRNGLTKQDKTAPKFADLVKRNFTADAPNRKWVGDITEIPTDSGKPVFGDCDRPVQPEAARRGNGPAPRRRAGLCGHQDGRGGPWWPRRDLA